LAYREIQSTDGHSGQETSVRKAMTTVAMSGLAVTLALAGCGSSKGDDGMTADLERDLSLALAAERPRTAVVSALEGGPTGAPSGTAPGRRDAVQTPRRAPRPTLQAEVQETATSEMIGEAPIPAEVVAEATQAPAPGPESETPAPSATVIDMSPGSGTVTTTAAGTGRDRGESGRRGGGMGGMIGVIIRGGGAGEDHCEIHDRRRGRNGGMAGGMIGTVIGRGGMGGYGGGIIMPNGRR